MNKHKLIRFFKRKCEHKYIHLGVDFMFRKWKWMSIYKCKKCGRFVYGKELDLDGKERN